MGVDDAHAVGADDAHAVLTGNAHELALHFAAGRAGLGEAGGDHHHAVYALLGAFPGCGHDQLGRDDDHGQVHTPGNVEDRLVGVDRLYDLGARVDRVDGAVEPAIHEVVEDFAADGASLASGADDGH